MRRVVPSASLLVLPVVILLALSLGAQQPSTPAREALPAWEYGSLELAQTSHGPTYVFSRYSPDGHVETELHSRPMVPAQRQPALGGTDAAAARSMAWLGREGWELVTETGFARFGGDAPVLMFKRRAGAR